MHSNDPSNTYYQNVENSLTVIQDIIDATPNDYTKASEECVVYLQNHSAYVTVTSSQVNETVDNNSILKEDATRTKAKCKGQDHHNKVKRSKRNPSSKPNKKIKLTQGRFFHNSDITIHLHY